MEYAYIHHCMSHTQIPQGFHYLHLTALPGSMQNDLLLLRVPQSSWDPLNVHYEAVLVCKWHWARWHDCFKRLWQVYVQTFLVY